MDAFLAVLCVNKPEAEKAKVSMPTCGWISPSPSSRQDRDAAPCLIRHRLSPGRGLAADHGREAGWSSWTSSMTTSPSTPIRARHPACRPPRASAWPHRLRYARRPREDAGAPHRVILPTKVRAGTWRRPPSSRARRTCRGKEGGRLGRLQGRQRALWQVLRACRPSRGEERPAELSRQRRADDGEERFRLDGRESRAHPGEWSKRYEEQGGAEGSTLAALPAGATPAGPISLIPTIPDRMTAPSQPEAFLRVERLVKRFGPFQAPQGRRSCVSKGEFVCFLGPSGWCKTTLLRATPARSAERRPHLHRWARCSRKPLRPSAISASCSSYALFPNLTIADNVGYGSGQSRHDEGGDPGPRRRVCWR